MTGTELRTGRHRIAMACQYCRHHKIKCCGSDPCVNCTRAGHPCSYSPMSEEDKRLTRQRKAAAKVSYRPTRVAPSYVDQSVYSAPYLAGPGPISGTHVPSPRLFSASGIHAAPLPAYSPVPQAPAMPPHAQLESPWLLGPPVPVMNDPTMVPVHSAMTDEGSYDADEASAYATCTATPVSSTVWPASPSDPMPVTPLDKALLNTPPHRTLPHTSNRALFQAPSGLNCAPLASPFAPSPLSWATYPKSPTLCAGQAVQHNHPQQLNQPLLGLGIGLAYAPACHSITVGGEYLSVHGHWPQPKEHLSYLTSRQGQQQKSRREDWTLAETNF